jgi:hypothetical protein
MDTAKRQPQDDMWQPVDSNLHESVKNKADQPVKSVGEDEQWWITTGLNQGGKKLLGPFITRDLALSVRTYMEIAEAPATYWVEQEQQRNRNHYKAIK